MALQTDITFVSQKFILGLVMKTTSFQFICFLPCCYKSTNQEMYQHKSCRHYNCNNRWLIQIMAVRVETIVDQKCGNQSTHLLNLLHREVTADIAGEDRVGYFRGQRRRTSHARPDNRNSAGRPPGRGTFLLRHPRWTPNDYQGTFQKSVVIMAIHISMAMCRKTTK